MFYFCRKFSVLFVIYFLFSGNGLYAQERVEEKSVMTEVSTWNELVYEYTQGQKDSFGFTKFKIVFDKPISLNGETTPFTECPMVGNYCVNDKSYNGITRVVSSDAVEIMYPQGKGIWKRLKIKNDSGFQWGDGTKIIKLSKK